MAGEYLQPDHREAGGALRICLAQPETLSTCQEIRPDVGPASMPRRVLSELPDHLCVLINHKMSPRGRIKLLASLPTLSLSSPHTHCPTLCIIKAQGITSHLLTPVEQSPSLPQQEPRMRTKKKSQNYMRLGFQKLSSAKHNIVVGTLYRPL